MTVIKMMRIVLVLALTIGTAAYAKDANLSMIYTNALSQELPFAIYSGKSWAPDPKARFVKLHFYFDEPVPIKGIEIDSCDIPLDPKLSVFFNFDQWILSITPELEGRIPSALYPKKRGNKLVLGEFDSVVEVRSLTFNFENNTGFKICDIKLFDQAMQPYNIRVPKIVKGSISADSVLKPVSAYSPDYLFDSRFEYAWASDKKAKDVNLMLKFDKPQRVEKIRLWNGYQRSVTHCFANSRAKTLHLTGDKGYSAKVTVKDVLGSQVVTLPKPYSGKNLRIHIGEAYQGKNYRDLVISEMRLHDGKGWFMVDPTRALKAGIEANRKRFTKAKLGYLLNDSYYAEEELNKEPYWLSARLRLRADGSFYLSGWVGEAVKYFSLGNYEIKSHHPQKGMKLRLFGLYYESEEYGDCNGCGRDCNSSNANSGQKIFQEFFWLKPGAGNSVTIVNQNGGKRIKFDTLTLKREK